MMCKLLLSWTLLIATSRLLLAHPITDSSEMSYSGPVSVEEGQLVSPEELPLSDQAYLSQGIMSLGYPALMAAELNRDGLRTAGYLPREAVKEGLLGKPTRLNPFSRVLGTRKQYRKRGNASECFWKYCV